MIYKDSRYYDGPLTQVRDTRTGAYTISVGRDFPGNTYISYVEYTWVDGDQIDHLAHVFMGDATLWHIIMDYNPEVFDALAIRPGQVIRIPNG